MRKRLYILVFVLLISSNLSVGKDRNKSKNVKGSHKSPSGSHSKTKSDERFRRSIIDDEDDKPFWANRGKKQSEEELFSGHVYGDYRTNNKLLKASEKLMKEPPFWGNRGRRDSSSVEDFSEKIEYPKIKCQHCNDHFYTPLTHKIKETLMERRDDAPFWGNRGRRNSDELSLDDDVHDSLPFWGHRGRRQEDEPFWGNRGRREDEEPFWGNRGRREEGLPFWGNRGRRTQLSNFGNLAEEDIEPFWGNRGRKKDLQESIRDAINDVENQIVSLSQAKSTFPVSQTTFWRNQGRESALKHLFDGTPRFKSDFIQPIKKATDDGLETSKHDKTVRDNRIYAEEPYFILVERSSRSSGEIDPFYISRGKKEIEDFKLAKAARDRRGAIEEIVKSVKNDPYFIVRGKKDFGESNTKVNATSYEKISKAKNLICATLDMVLAKYNSGRNKREGSENDRGRRATLKKLAEQLQIDPYFVSRGKKSGDRRAKEENYEEFFYRVFEMCN